MSAVWGFDARFNALYEANYPAMRDYCLRRLSENDAPDAAAEIFAVAWRRIEEIPTGTDDARRWLYGVARNVVAHQRRGHARRNRLATRLRATTRESAPGADIPVVRRLEDARVADALARLKETDREVLLLKLWEELSHADIASILGVSSHAVDMRVKRATARLGKLLGIARNASHRVNPEGGEA